jgi:hypothetical protein
MRRRNLGKSRRSDKLSGQEIGVEKILGEQASVVMVLVITRPLSTWLSPA